MNNILMVSFFCSGAFLRIFYRFVLQIIAELLFLKWFLFCLFRSLCLSVSACTWVCFLLSLVSLFAVWLCQNPFEAQTLFFIVWFFFLICLNLQSPLVGFVLSWLLSRSSLTQEKVCSQVLYSGFRFSFIDYIK